MAGRPSLLLALGLAAAGALTLASCRTPFQKGPVEPRLEPGARTRLGPGDVLKVEVWGESTVSRDLVLGPDGRATVPLVGPVELGGYTPEKAGEAIATALERYLRDPQVQVALVESRSVKIEVLGEVYEPGTYPWYEGDTVVTAIERASGFVPMTAAFWNVHLVRGALDHPKVWKVDLERVLDSRADDVPVEPGDLIYVPPRWATSFDRWTLQAFGPIISLFGLEGEIEDASRAGSTVEIVAPPLDPGTSGTPGGPGPGGGGGGGPTPPPPTPLPPPIPPPLPLPGG